MQKQEKFEGSYGSYFQKRPISAKVEKKYGDDRFQDFIVNIQNKMVQTPKFDKNSPTMKDNYKNILNRIQKTRNEFEQKQINHQQKMNLSNQNQIFQKKVYDINQSVDSKKRTEQKVILTDFKNLQSKMTNLENKIKQIKQNQQLNSNSSKVYESLKNQIQQYFQKKDNSSQKKNNSLQKTPDTKKITDFSLQGWETRQPMKQDYSIQKQEIKRNSDYNISKTHHSLNKGLDLNFKTSEQQISPFKDYSITKKDQPQKKLSDLVTSISKSNQNCSIAQKINQSIKLNNQPIYSNIKNYNNIAHVFYISNAITSFFNPNQKNQYTREHFMQTMQSINLVKNIGQPHQSKINDRRYIKVSQLQKGKKTLIFDLDETLIHCNDVNIKNSDIVLPIQFPTGERINAGINIRPYAKQILKELSEFYEIMIFTASHACYANVVLDYLDPQNLYIQHRLFRESCIQTDEGFYVKDLRVINREMSDMIIVDNAAYSFAYQIDNGIPILNYYENKEDKELLDLMDYLKKMLEYRDVREMNKKSFKLKQFVCVQDPVQLIQILFNQLLK